MPNGVQGNYTGEILRRTRPKTFRQVVHLLAEGVSNRRIQRILRVHQDTIKAIQKREAEGIDAHKKSVLSVLGSVSVLGAERMERTISKASFRDATIGTGVAVDKILALTGQLPSVQVAVVMPNETERADMRTLDAKLDAIARRLALNRPNTLELPEK